MDDKCKFNLNVNSSERNANKAHHSMSEAWYCHVSKARLKTPRFCTPGLCTRGLLQPEQSKSSQSCTPQNISAYPIEQQEHPKTRSSNTTVAPKNLKKNKCLRREKRRCQKKKWNSHLNMHIGTQYPGGAVSQALLVWSLPPSGWSCPSPSTRFPSHTHTYKPWGG